MTAPAPFNVSLKKVYSNLKLSDFQTQRAQSGFTRKPKRHEKRAAADACSSVGTIEKRRLRSEKKKTRKKTHYVDTGPKHMTSFRSLGPF